MSSGLGKERIASELTKASADGSPSTVATRLLFPLLRWLRERAGEVTEWISPAFNRILSPLANAASSQLSGPSALVVAAVVRVVKIVRREGSVGGGYENAAEGYWSVVGGGVNNIASGHHSTVSGGFGNMVSGKNGTVGGGHKNKVSGSGGTVSGGWYNTAKGEESTIGGGSRNMASSKRSTISGGYQNIAKKKGATIGGGEHNIAEGGHSTIGGGYKNTASGASSTIGGGEQNTAKGGYSTVGGGEQNTAADRHSTISGGYQNIAEEEGATIGGGEHNVAEGYHSTIGGGYKNTASGRYSTIGGGKENTADGRCSTVCGGENNTASGNYSVVVGGSHNIANGRYNLVFGENVIPTMKEDYRVYFFGDGSSTNEFEGDTVAASGCVVINRLQGRHPIHVGTNGTNGNGAYLSAGGVWTNASSRAKKDRFRLLDAEEVLGKIRALPVEGWYYKGTNEYHIGPYAEDFHEAFGTGLLDRPEEARGYLAASDVAGVALVGIQALAERDEAYERRIAALEAENAQLRAAVEVLQVRQTALETENAALRAQQAAFAAELERLRAVVGLKAEVLAQA